MKTSERFTQPAYAAMERFVTGAFRPSICSVEASPAKTSHSLETEKGWTGPGQDFGSNTSDSWARYDRVSSSWRTSQLSLFEGLDEFLETWPNFGSMRSGEVYRRAPWVRHTCDNDCSLWPTPTASMDGRGFGIPLHERSGRYKQSTVSRVRDLVLQHGWRIHPHFTEALMGFPIGWSAIEASETP
jgi:hypothetical protein